MKVIVGLGNPEDQYQNTRHNLGFKVVEELGKKLVINGSWFVDKNLKSQVLKVYELQTTNNESLSRLLSVDNELLLVKPQTYMNNSGLAVKNVVDYFKIPTEDLIVVYDELDLPLGRLKVRQGGGAAGHHGVESIIEVLGTDNFIRVRLGIGNQLSENAETGQSHFDSSKFVLEPFLPQENIKVNETVKLAVEAIKTLLNDGLEAAQNQFH